LKLSDKKQNVFDELKKQALKDFDQLVKGKIKTSNEEGEGGFFTTLVNNVGQNITIKLSDIEFVYIFHISNKEIVKFGLVVDNIELGPCPKSLFNNSKAKDMHIKKHFKIQNLAVYFDVYDETFVQKQHEKEEPEEAKVLN
jgi:hypothetical protein